MRKTFPFSFYFLLLPAVLLSLSAFKPALAAPPMRIDIPATVIKVPLAQGVSPSDAVQSMKLRANLLNFKLVAQQPLSAQLKAMGVKHVRTLDIYQFCKPDVAYDMVNFNMAYAAYLPCRIALEEDAKGRYWLTMLNPNLLLSPDMPAALKKQADSVISGLMQIIKAGAEGAL